MRRSGKKKFSIAIDLGGTNLRSAVVDSAGKVQFRRSVPTARELSPNAVIAQIVGLCHTLIEIAKSRNIRPVGIGIGAPGFVDESRSVILSSPNLPGWKKVPLKEAVQKRVRLRVVLENDANCAAFGEHWVGAGRRSENMICLTLGTGVGSGIIVEGRMIRGSRGCGGEAGHLCVEPEGVKCGCGSRGCLETLASGSAILRLTGFPGETLQGQAQKGKHNALRAFEAMGRHLGIGLASLCFLFDPELIILGGKLAGAYRYFAPAMRKEMRQRLVSHPARQVKVTLARCGDDAGLLGAAFSVFST